ncbi:MAG: hypothetical protein ACLUVG_18080 [Phocaeicola vulgatus]
MDWTRSWLDNFKIRASWGRLGSQPDTEYPYQSVFGTEQDTSCLTNTLSTVRYSSIDQS